MRVPVRLLPLAALASWEPFRTAACVLAGRAARQSRRRWEGDAAMKNTSAETAGGGVSLRAVAEGSPRTRASLDLVTAMKNGGTFRARAVPRRRRGSAN